MNNDFFVDSKNYGDLLKKCCISATVVIIYFLLQRIQCYGINNATVKLVQQSAFIRLFDTFSGGNFSNLPIGALGIAPFVTSSIIIQLLSTDMGNSWYDFSIKSFVEWNYQGSVGQKKKDILTSLLSIPLAIATCLTMLATINKQSLQSTHNTIYANAAAPYLVVLQMTIASVFLTILCLKLNKQGIIQNISLIIMSGIFIKLPKQISTSFISMSKSDSIMGLFILFVVVSVVIFSMRIAYRIPLHFANELQVENDSYIPVTWNPGGMMSIIFASLLLGAFQAWGNILPVSKQAHIILNSLFNIDTNIGLILYGTLIIIFSFIYAYIQYNPVQIGLKLRQYGGTIEDYRDENEGLLYFKRILSRYAVYGALLMIVVAIMPQAIAHAIHGLNTPLFKYMGSSIMIITSALFELKMRLYAEVVSINYSSK